RCHGWCFTTFKTDPEHVFDERVFSYLVFGREACPTSGRRHLQGFVWFVDRKRLASAKKIFPDCHLEASKGSPQQAADYCKKDGDFQEYGRLPDSQHKSNAFAAVLAAAEEGDVDAIKRDYPGLYLRYQKNILSSVAFRTRELENSCGVWICGPPRRGKDAGVRRLGDVYSKPLNKWWDGYRDEEFVLVSDIEPSHSAWLGYYLKIWSDRYPFQAEIKGASILIRPVKIFCTSNFRLEEVFSGQILDALQARFNIFDRYDNTVKRRQESAPNWSVFDQLLKEEDGLAELTFTENVPVPSTAVINVPIPSTAVINVPVPSTAVINVPVPSTSEEYIPAASMNVGYSSSEQFQKKKKTRRN
ncbi:Replication-associated protein, partial [Araneus ventricosus]